MKNFGQNIHLTDSKFVVVEADESDGTVFKLNPSYLLYLNVDREHMDYYKNYSVLKKKIKTFISRVSKKSKVFLNRDDKFLKTLTHTSKNIIPFGGNSKSIYSYKIQKLIQNKSIFYFYFNKKKIIKNINSPLLESTI